MAEDIDLASRRLLAVTEEELSRIVLDIHDGPVQYLFAALSLVTKLEKQVESRQAGATEMLPTLHRVSELVESSLHEIKSFLGTFRPPEFHRRSLASIVQGIVIQHEEWTGISVDLRVLPLPGVVSLPVKIALYRILQEGLSNGYRHARVTQQWVTLWTERGQVCLEIVDKGQGFQPPPLEGPGATEREEHIGLRGMRDRVKMLGGVFRLHSQPGEGTVITVKIPADDSREKEEWLNVFE